jgi:hypothetical protein
MPGTPQLVPLAVSQTRKPVVLQNEAFAEGANQEAKPTTQTTAARRRNFFIGSPRKNEDRMVLQEGEAAASATSRTWGSVGSLFFLLATNLIEEVLKFLRGQSHGSLVALDDVFAKVGVHLHYDRPRTVRMGHDEVVSLDSRLNISSKETDVPQLPPR